MSTKEIELCGKKLDLHMEEGLKLCCVTSIRNITIPAGVEIIIPGRIHEEVQNSVHGGTALIEPHPHLIAKDGLIGAHSLAVVPHNSSTVPVRIMNVSTEPVTIFKSSNIGKLSMIDQIIKDKTTKQSQKQKLPGHLHDLFQRSKTKLDQNQEKLKQFMVDNESSFAKDDFELGRTNEVMHKINCGSALPIKQRQRRVPLHQKKEVEDALKKMLEQNVIEESRYTRKDSLRNHLSREHPGVLQTKIQPKLKSVVNKVDSMTSNKSKQPNKFCPRTESKAPMTISVDKRKNNPEVNSTKKPAKKLGDKKLEEELIVSSSSSDDDLGEDPQIIIDVVPTDTEGAEGSNMILDPATGKFRKMETRFKDMACQVNQIMSYTLELVFEGMGIVEENSSSL
ncbi:hypothetical protein LOTGIDRAFT_171408 [Lottia gigantea]|uniref:dUTPase-like domain-containing protein n=1 Tax=Lottia gigantea TaxID=225164 RepID=V4B7C5_LOTGI|nr:hypothetical protein LOTGIDRAFT_171408 [Lottia gigantea]ESP03471.1 hypothetical protein LOTGIDRAFT_171408 [Lottia gigantea]